MPFEWFSRIRWRNKVFNFFTRIQWMNELDSSRFNRAPESRQSVRLPGLYFLPHIFCVSLSRRRFATSIRSTSCSFSITVWKKMNLSIWWSFSRWTVDHLEATRFIKFAFAKEDKIKKLIDRHKDTLEWNSPHTKIASSLHWFKMKQKSRPFHAFYKSI